VSYTSEFVVQGRAIELQYEAPIGRPTAAEGCNGQLNTWPWTCSVFTAVYTFERKREYQWTICNHNKAFAFVSPANWTTIQRNSGFLHIGTDGYY